MAAAKLAHHGRQRMPIAVDTSKAPQLVRWTITGPWPGITEVGMVRERLIAEGHLTEATRGLLDIRNVETIPNYADVAPMIAAASRGGGLPWYRAYVVASAEQFGIVRQMKSLAPPGYKIEIFFNDAEALAWLGSQ
jgi:hypothetical protein